ncbi:MAG: glycosyltransferase family 4 protein [Hyphomonadaceae bacterium]|nr:glycosyltransferase family 4 protein [Hyphomonadaceae bacterium]
MAWAEAAARSEHPEQAARIARNYAEFDHYAARARSYLDAGELATAAIHCAIASHIAVQNHAGVFWSPKLERVLNEVGRRIPFDEPPSRPREIKRVLQVGTQMSAVGGHNKMLCQWVNADRDRHHALVLTQQRGPVPAFAQQAFASGGIHYLSRNPGGPLAWARELRRMARDYDAVVLHTYCEDVIPIMAFADPVRHKPVLVLNHADHLFWFGPSVCHLAINLREAAQDLTIARRGVAPERNIIMPTLAESVVRRSSRDDAKRAIGVSPETILLVSAARQLKYKTVGGATFADIHAPLLEKHPNATLLVVGAGTPEDWQPVRARFGDRLRSLPETPNPRPYFEAADIYVDSYPFVSSTSLMEAAGYGAPSVTIFPYPDETRIFGINHVALVGNVAVARNFEQYRVILSELIEDGERRAAIGEESRLAVAREHNVPGWMRWLEGVYARALELPPLDNAAMLAGDERPSFGEPDWRHEDIFGGNWPTIERIKNYMGMLPTHQHLAHWSEVRAAGGFRSASEALRYLAPEWLKRRLKDGV